MARRSSSCRVNRRRASACSSALLAASASRMRSASERSRTNSSRYSRPSWPVACCTSPARNTLPSRRRISGAGVSRLASPASGTHRSQRTKRSRSSSTASAGSAVSASVRSSRPNSSRKAGLAKRTCSPSSTSRPSGITSTSLRNGGSGTPAAAARRVMSCSVPRTIGWPVPSSKASARIRNCRACPAASVTTKRSSAREPWPRRMDDSRCTMRCSGAVAAGAAKRSSSGRQHGVSGTGWPIRRYSSSEKWP